MIEKSNRDEIILPDHSIDITGLICPMTFVRTKLKLEKIQPGEILEVRLKGEEPLHNVPRSAKQHGHTVLDIAVENPDEPENGIHRLLIRKEDV